MTKIYIMFQNMPLLTLCNITHVNTKYSEISTELMIVNIMTGFVSVEKSPAKHTYKITNDMQLQPHSCHISTLY